MTASRTWRSRSFRDATMSPKLLPANNLHRSWRAGQVTHEGVESEPALGAAHHPLPLHLSPPLTQPGGQAVGRTGGTRQARIGTQREIQTLQFPLLVGQDLLGFDRGLARSDGATIALPPGEIPATRPAIERMGGGAEPEVGVTRPVRRVVA